MSAKIVALIPARSGSKGVKDKNVQLLRGKPLIAYSIETAIATKSIDRVFVSTDSSIYANIARNFGAEVPFLRPAAISGDDSTDLEFVLHFLDWWEGALPQYIIHLRPTTPFRDSLVVATAIATMGLCPDATALRSVHCMAESAYKTFEIAMGRLRQVGCSSFDLDAANAPRHTFTPTYEGNGYVDILKPDFVLKKRLLHGNHVLPFITPNVGEIDTLYDLRRLNAKG